MSLRRNTSLVALLGLFVSTAASAAPGTCLSPDQQDAFDVGALKSALSVEAVACGNEDDYNAFVIKHRPELVAEDGTVNAWFKRQYGKSAQPRYDSYITLLANEQSEVGQHQGSDYCPRLKLMYPEVMAVPTPQLAQYAAAKNLVPEGLTPCLTPVSASSSSSKSRGKSETHHTTTHKK